MDSQKLVKNNLTYAATLAAGEVSSLRITEDERTTVRVYDGGFIGVAGRIGAGDDAALMAQAQGALAQKIPYPDAVGTGEVRQVNLKKQIIAEGDFLNTVRRLAARLKERFPRFIFSDKFYLDNGSITYTDTAGTKLSFSAGEVAMGLSIKAAGSANIMDLWYGASRDYYDEDGRLIYESAYITHGSLDYFFIYTDGSCRPAYCLQLDNNLGYCIPLMVELEY